MTTVLELVHEIEKLTPDQRVEVVDAVMRQAIPPDRDIDKIWATEAAARWSAYKSGKIAAVPYETVMARYSRT
jgi:putative addiction module component (TIGR02574 family)